MNRQEPITYYLEAAEAASEAAVAEAAAADADMSAAEAAADAAGAASEAAIAGAGAGGVTMVSSFLLQAPSRATEATRDANRSDFLIFVLNLKVEQLPVIVGPLQFHRAPTLTRPESSSISNA